MRRKHALPVLVGNLVLLAAGVAMSVLILSPQVKAGPEGKPAAIASGPRPVWAQGRVEPISGELTLAIGAVGPLAAVYVHTGQKVHRGQLLAELQDNDQKARIAEAKASAEVRQAELKRLLNGARAEKRRRVAAELARAAANLTWAQHQVGRLQPLAAKSFASQEALDEAQSKLAVARAQRDAAKAAVALINAPPRPEDVAIARANLSLAEAKLAAQRALLGKMQVRSPIDGVVLRRYLKAGEVVSVQPLTPIMKIGEIRRLKVIAEVDETQVARVKLGEQASITADGYAGERFHGIVSRISPMMGPKTVFSDKPTDKIDTKILDVTINLGSGTHLPIGLRVDVKIIPPAALPTD